MRDWQYGCLDVKAEEIMYKFANVQDFIKSGRITPLQLLQIRSRIGPENQKYLEWVVRIYLKSKLGIDDITEYRDDLNDFSYLVKINRIDPNINKIKNFDELRYEVHGAKLQIVYMALGSQKEIKKDIKQTGSEVVWNKNNIKVILIKTKEAACLYGAGTKWCVSGEVGNKFYEYSGEANFYVIITNTNEKYGLVMFDDGSVRTYNSNDQLVATKKIIKDLGIPMSVFKSKANELETLGGSDIMAQRKTEKAMTNIKLSLRA
jgi:hypothetical protein